MRRILRATALIGGFSLTSAFAPAFAQDAAAPTGGNPRANEASHTAASTPASEIAPQLPSPKLGPDASARDYLLAAKQAVAARHTGMAQEALEMAETRTLDRSTEASAAGTADADPMIMHIHDALAALGTKDLTAAGGAIDQALSLAAPT